MMTSYDYLATVSGVDNMMRTRDVIMANTEIIAWLGQGLDGKAYRVTYKGVEACMKEAWDWSDLEKTHMMCEAKALCIVDGAAGAPKLLAASEDGSVLIMEYCDGYTLDEFAAQVVSSEDRTKVTQDLKLAVEALHKTGYTHGDIHGENIMVCGGPGQYHVRLIDFGHCKELDDEDVVDELWTVNSLRLI